MQRFLNNWSVLCTATEAHFGKGTKGDTALPTLPNPHYPSKIANTLALLCTITLASLVKGRWIDGKAQTVALLRLNCDTPALFITKPFCRQDGGIASPPSLRTTFLPPLVKGEVMSPEKIRATTGGIVTLTFAPHPTLPKPHYPSKIANTLASLVKGRWIDGKAQTVALLCLNCDTPALFITKPFCRQDGGIAAPTFAPHYPTRFSCCEFDSPTSHKNKIRPRFHGGELISISLSGVWGVAPMWVVSRWCRCVCALTAICAVASCNGFVWLSLCVLA